VIEEQAPLMGPATVILTNDPCGAQFCAWVMKASPKFAPWRPSRARQALDPDQNSKLWAMLTDVARQADLGRKEAHHRGVERLVHRRREVGRRRSEAVPGLEGGLMILGLHTSEMSVAEMADVQTYISSLGRE
jgi:hypothetical protein